MIAAGKPMVPAPYTSSRARTIMIIMIILVYDLGAFTGGRAISVIYPPQLNSDLLVPHFTGF
jgi:hypothetical protein